MIKTETGSQGKFLDASNRSVPLFLHHSGIHSLPSRFFTLIPHDFGMRQPPMLDSPDLVKSKIEMLDNLLEIEIAYSLLSGGEKDAAVDPIDAHYKKLKTEVEVLERSSEEFAVIQEYVKNTHASTHTQYSLEIEHVFKVARKVSTWHDTWHNTWHTTVSITLSISPPSRVLSRERPSGSSRSGRCPIGCYCGTAPG